MIRLLLRVALLLLPFTAANALAEPARQSGEPYEFVRGLQAVHVTSTRDVADALAALGI